MFAGNFAPAGWRFCEGAVLPIAGNAALFNKIGTTYGGNGTTTFALPDLRGRVPVHQGGGGLVLGQTGGAEVVTLAVNQIPSHTHALGAIGGQAGTKVSPAGNRPAESYNVTPYLNDAPTGSFNAAAVESVGGSQPHPNVQPFLCIHFIISMLGS
jgi:microcystin-dependent protein